MMPLTVQLNELVPHSVTDLAWQRTSDAVFEALALNGFAIVQLRVGGRHQAALQAAYDLFRRQPSAPSAPDHAGRVAWEQLGLKQVLTLNSGPWQAGALDSQQRSGLQVCAAFA